MKLSKQRYNIKRPLHLIVKDSDGFLATKEAHALLKESMGGNNVYSVLVDYKVIFVSVDEFKRYGFVEFAIPTGFKDIDIDTECFYMNPVSGSVCSGKDYIQDYLNTKDDWEESGSKTWEEWGGNTLIPVKWCSYDQEWKEWEA